MSRAALLLAAPAGAAAVLLLATHRAWLCRRTWVENVAFLALAAPAALVLGSLPPVVARALAPIDVLAAFWLAAAVGAWRFAPDRGQSGLGWAAADPLAAAVPVGLAVAVVHAALLAPALPASVHLVLLLAAALAAHAAFPRPHWP